MQDLKAIRLLRGFVGCLLLSGLLQIHAQQAGASDPQSFAEKSNALIVNAREVVLDIVVTDSKGKPIEGLKAEDFRLVENGIPQKIRNFSEQRPRSVEEINRMSPLANLPANLFTSFTPVRSTNTVNVILIDGLDSPPGAQIYVRQELEDLFKRMPEGNTFAIFQMDTEMHLVQGFTSDRQMLLNAVESRREMPSLWQLPCDPAHPDSVYCKLRHQFLNESFDTMGRYLAGFSGRKNLIWFTGEVPYLSLGGSHPFPDAVDYDSISGRADVQSLSRVAVYPVDDRGLSVTSSDVRTNEHEDMQMVAEMTGGKAFFNTNGLRQAVSEIIDTSAHYYTLSYSPANTNWDNQYRTIDLHASDKKWILEYRHGYYARKERPRLTVGTIIPANRAFVAPSATQRSQQPEQQSLAASQSKEAFEGSMQLGAVPAGEILFNVSITPATTIHRVLKSAPLPPANFLRASLHSKPFRNYRLLYVIDPGTAGFIQTPDHMHHARLEYVVVVYTPEGQVVNSLVTTNQIDLGGTAFAKAVHLQLGVGSTQEIAIPIKGNYFLRVGVHDLDNDAFGTTEIPVDSIRLGIAGPGQDLQP